MVAGPPERMPLLRGVFTLGGSIVLKPGFASLDADVSTDSGFADDVSSEEASAIWHRFHLCFRCENQPICKWATTEEAPVVIARCLSFVAIAGAPGDNG